MSYSQYLTTPYQINHFKRENINQNYSLIVEKVVANLIDEATLYVIEKNITLSIYDLVIPTENFRTGKIPRPQNSFIIYRRNYQARLALSDAPNVTLNRVSKITSNKWRKESREIRKVFDILAECAKKVHKCIYPDYVYNPKKQATTTVPMSFKNNQNNQHNVCDPSRIQSPEFTPPIQSSIQLSPILSWNSSSISPLTLEINPDFMKSFDEKMCKKFDFWTSL
ncbi:hypothetical protein C1645_748914 [Glomus cerebriforme]|uniref:HMG box domain-containing protein n=2 Tax=Glomus cerebriforme TaxID=658196 RepID=A0A397TQF5_9GLOM|nr:hypothetical protein C1645_748914 [Glomus cerebriforme]